MKRILVSPSLSGQRSGAYGSASRPLSLAAVGPYDDGDRDTAVPRGRDELPHQADDLGGKEGVERAVVDAERLTVQQLDLSEAGLEEFAGEVVLGERARDAPGPGGRLGQDLNGQVVLFYRQVRNAQPAAGSQDAGALGHHPCLSRGEVDHTVGDDQVNAVVGQRDRLHLALDW